jgi:DNA-binding HxlR family transcriptional regulator
VKKVSFADMHCSVAQALEVVGEWWTLLILRDAFLGVTRFDDFASRGSSTSPTVRTSA